LCKDHLQTFTLVYHAPVIRYY